MPEKRINLTPDTATKGILGIEGAAEINQALDQFAQIIMRGDQELAALDWSRGQWNCLADACNGAFMAAGFMSPQHLAAANLSDFDHLDAGGKKWELDDGDIARMCDQLNSLSAYAGIAIEYLVRWFWANTDIPATEHDWWTPHFRRRWGAR
jgi:hypothetical protein